MFSTQKTRPPLAEAPPPSAARSDPGSTTEALNVSQAVQFSFSARAGREAGEPKRHIHEGKKKRTKRSTPSMVQGRRHGLELGQGTTGSRRTLCWLCPCASGRTKAGRPRSPPSNPKSQRAGFLPSESLRLVGRLSARPQQPWSQRRQAADRLPTPLSVGASASCPTRMGKCCDPPVSHSCRASSLPRL